jgi:hypothetical protein
VYILYTPLDQSWLDYLTSPGQWLSGATVNSVASIADLVMNHS